MEPIENNSQPSPTPPRRNRSALLRQKRTFWIIIAAIAAVLIFVAIAWALTKDKPTPPSQVESRINKTVQTSLGRVDGINIKFDPGTGTASIVQTEQTEIPEISAQNVRTAYILLVRLGNQVFDNKDVKNIQVVEKVKLNFPEDPANEFLPEDQRATRPSVVTDVVTIAMSKSNFQSVNWQEYDDKPVSKLMIEKSYKYTINPTLDPLLNEDQLYLDL